MAKRSLSDLAGFTFGSTFVSPNVCWEEFKQYDRAEAFVKGKRFCPIPNCYIKGTLHLNKERKGFLMLISSKGKSMRIYYRWIQEIIVEESYRKAKSRGIKYQRDLQKDAMKRLKRRKEKTKKPNKE